MEPTDCGEAYSERERRALRPAPDVGPGAMTVSNLCDRALGALVSNARPWNGTDAGGIGWGRVSRVPGAFTLLHQAVREPRFYTFTVSSGPNFYTALMFRWRAARATHRRPRTSLIVRVL